MNTIINAGDTTNATNLALVLGLAAVIIVIALIIIVRRKKK